MKQAITCFIFDLDGTLFFNYEANYEAYRRAFQGHSVDLTQEAYSFRFGLRAHEMIHSIAPHLSAEEREAVRKNKAKYYRESVHLVVPNEPLIAFLKYVKKSALTALATTASRHNALFLLKHFGLDQDFSLMLFGEDVTHPKPNPECYLMCMDRLQVKPENSLIFEDSETGIAAACASGASYVVVSAPKDERD
jgi:HAD superfamily hydrolase (TIGR01509 family)